MRLPLRRGMRTGERRRQEPSNLSVAFYLVKKIFEANKAKYKDLTQLVTVSKDVLHTFLNV